MKHLKRGSSWTLVAALAALVALSSGCGNHGQGRAIWVAPAITVSAR